MTLFEGIEAILYCTGLRKGRGLSQRDPWTLTLDMCGRKMGIGQTPSLFLLGKCSATFHSTSTPRPPGNQKVPIGSLGLRSVLGVVERERYADLPVFH